MFAAARVGADDAAPGEPAGAKTNAPRFDVSALQAALPDVQGYQTPPEPLRGLATAPPTPWTLVTPDRRSLVIFDWNRLTRLEELARPELGLAGQRIQPDTFGPSRTVPFTGIRLQDIDSGEVRPVRGLPGAPSLTRFDISPDGATASMVHTGADGIELWVVDMARAEARRLTGPILNQTNDVKPMWMDSATLLVTLKPEGLGPPPAAPATPGGPTTQQSLGKEAASRTFQDLLENEHDIALWEHYFTGQLAKVDVASGRIERIGPVAVHWDFDPSPDGRYVLAEILHRPWSYEVLAYRFPRRIEVWDRDGNVVHTITDLPLHDQVPTAFGSVPTGVRSIRWRGDVGATLVWAEAQDGGDARVDTEIRDRIYQLAAPFDGEPKALVDLPLRFGGIWSGDGSLLMISSFWWPDRSLQVWRLAPDADDPAPVLVEDRSYRDYYADPGSPVTRVNEFGRSVLHRTPAGKLLLVGRGATPEGDKPFLDVADPVTRETERLFRSDPPPFEEVVTVLDEEGRRILTRRESKEEPPNYFVRDLTAAGAGDDPDAGLRQLTHFPHPTPQLADIQKELIHYQRADGVDLSATLYLPGGYDPERDGPLPMLMWAYPLDYQDASLASQVVGSPHQFSRLSFTSPLFWLSMGYAVLDNPKMPIIGEGEDKPNDRFVAQLVSSAEAAVDEVVRRGVARRGHIAIGGHSYGAFMTANLLAHSDLFDAGIAQSGAYNRTLTPFGFQSEERSLWEAPEIYFEMSPFMHADEIDEPILLVHGEQDNNSGTFPLQSERFYEAIKGHGGFARLVMLPHESHSYRAEESVLHLLWEIHRWMDATIGLEPPIRVEMGEPGIEGD